MADIVDDMIKTWAPEDLWKIAQPLIPVPAKRPQGGGKRRADDRAVLAAIAYMTQAGCSWRKLPAAFFGVSRPTVHRRFTEWTRHGLWDQLHYSLLTQLNKAGGIDGDRILGTAKMGPNRAGPGAHVSTASFMVAAADRGRGAGTTLLRFALDWAGDRGYAAMQFNAVVESNRSAVELYRRHGFDVIGTAPRAFAHPTLGRIGLHIMFNEF